jgi:hypothetical protein
VKLIDDVVGSERAAEVRARLARAGWKRYALLDRGSFDFVEAPDEPDLLAALSSLARAVTGRTLVPERARAVRLLPGDYVLVRHDRVYEDRPVEVVVDLSAAPVAGAEVHYRHRGQVFFVVPARPGAAAVVERGPTVMRNETYVSRREGWAGAEVVRLFVLLRDATSSGESE